MPKIEGIEINSDTITNCYKKFYPATYKIMQENLFHYLHLFGIRVSTCDTSIPDDIVGGLRVSNLGFNELVTSQASTDPSPKTLVKLHDAEAISKGGTAFMMPGQYDYYYNGTNHKKWRPFPSFCPAKPVRVYRWMPSKEAVAAWKNGAGKPLSELFESAVKSGLVKISTSSDTCIHRAWSSQKLYADSAGCQVLSDYNSLTKLGKFASDHIKKRYGNIFTYTLFTAEQFVQANRGFSYVPIYPTTGISKPADTSGFWGAITKLLFGKK